MCGTFPCNSLFCCLSTLYISGIYSRAKIAKSFSVYVLKELDLVTSGIDPLFCDMQELLYS